MQLYESKAIDLLYEIKSFQIPVCTVIDKHFNLIREYRNRALVLTRTLLYTVHSIGQTEWNYYKPANVTVKDLHFLWVENSTIRYQSFAIINKIVMLCRDATPNVQGIIITALINLVIRCKRKKKRMLLLPYRVKDNLIIINKWKHTCSGGVRECSRFLLERSLKVPCRIAVSEGLKNIKFRITEFSKFQIHSWANFNIMLTRI